MLLVARQPVERLGNNDIELSSARILEQALIGRSQCARAANGAVSVGVQILPALVLDPLAAEPDLILDRRLALLAPETTQETLCTFAASSIRAAILIVLP